MVTATRAARTGSLVRSSANRQRDPRSIRAQPTMAGAKPRNTAETSRVDSWVKLPPRPVNGRRGNSGTASNPSNPYSDSCIHSIHWKHWRKRLPARSPRDLPCSANPFLTLPHPNFTNPLWMPSTSMRHTSGSKSKQASCARHLRGWQSWVLSAAT